MSIAASLFGQEFRPNAPASVDALQSFKSQRALRISDEYLAFLTEVNGGEGSVGENAYLILFPIEELVTLNTAYEVDEWAKGLVIFGSDGGGEAFAFDTRTWPPSIVSVPFVGMSLDLAREVASDLRGFSQFLSQE